MIGVICTNLAIERGPHIVGHLRSLQFFRLHSSMASVAVLHLSTGKVDTVRVSLLSSYCNHHVSHQKKLELELKKLVFKKGHPSSPSPLSCLA